MIVAGIGFRRIAAAEDIVALVEQALERAALTRDSLAKLATIKALADMPAFAESARRLAVLAIAVEESALAAAAQRVRTQSARSIAAHGVGSVAEAAALAAAGPRSELVLTRIASASATCALARLETAP
ncbi:cobalamin biosynthesis protein [Microvirga lotononidis]|uniref:CbiG protein n=1 Tax=Microvirga lotononidis TaxID=864069 RepID=I4YWT3_9HYPH|nr:cobalamin biosynthesis protein [Microvirga lotononidis]EIM28425.1 CbiG protein [Microvirga lotononidis]WQO27495.1 cobalamin biosynthesis protein [Microvirga lotononidis]